MKITCEHCGTAINIEKEKICPSCKAPYDKNKEYLKIKDNISKNNDLNIKIKESVLDTLKDGKKIGIAFAILFCIVLLVIMGMTIYTFIKEINKHNNKLIESNIPNTVQIDDRVFDEVEDYINKTKDQINNQIEETQKQKKHITVGLNEKAKLDEYNIVCDKVKVYKSDKKGYKKVRVHMKITKKSDDSFILVQPISCLVKGVAQKELLFDNINNDLPLSIQQNITVQGYKSFEIPTSAKKIEIRYGDDVTIKISL